MSTDSGETPMAWLQAMQKSQSDWMRQWTQWAAPFMPPTAPGAMTGGSGAGAPPAAGSAGGGGADLAQQVLSQVEQSLGVSRAMWDLLGRSAALADTGQRVATFNDGLQQLQGQLGRFFAPMAAFGPGAAAGMSMPGMPPLGQQMFNPLAFGLPFAGLPGIGPAREQQESMERLASLAQRVMQAQAQLATQWGQLMQNALRELGSSLAPRLQAGALPGSLREVYDQWVATAEKMYAGAAGGASFAQAQSELANALSQLRIAQRDWLEEWGRTFDLPTRAELNSLHHQVRALKDAVQKLGGKV